MAIEDLIGTRNSSWHHQSYANGTRCARLGQGGGILRSTGGNARSHPPHVLRNSGPGRALAVAMTTTTAPVSRLIHAEPAPTSLLDRDLSWLAFNGRVLQEAEDQRREAASRLRFAAIVSSNLDEFYRVRVAATVAMLRESVEQAVRTRHLHRLHTITETVVHQQQRLGQVLWHEVLPALAQEGFPVGRIDDAVSSTSAQRNLARLAVLPLLAEPLCGDAPALVDLLEDQVSYLVGRSPGGILWFVGIPKDVPRFHAEASAPPIRYFIDDLARLALAERYAEVGPQQWWAIKLTRDANLSVTFEPADELELALQRAIELRRFGAPARLLIDSAMPADVVDELRQLLRIDPAYVVAGARYHNLRDLHQLAALLELRTRSVAPATTGQSVPELQRVSSVLDHIGEGDRVLHFPYHRFDVVLEALHEAARDASVRAVAITLYRVGADSPVVSVLEEIARGGKPVFAFVEVTARFDERENLEAGARLERAGVTVRRHLPNCKVHAKLLLVDRGDAPGRSVVYLSTGNFNAANALIYTDHGLFTADSEIVADVRRVFHFLQHDGDAPTLSRLLMAPHSLRQGLGALIDAEIFAAQAGLPSGIQLKLNALEDSDMIHHLLRAAREGVPVRVIVRGICRLPVDVASMPALFSARSVIDDHLEHGRIYRFHARGEDRLFLSSADWMTRNMDRRVEIAVPIYDPAVRAELLQLLLTQLADTASARELEPSMLNTRLTPAGGVRAQRAFGDWLATAGRLT